MKLNHISIKNMLGISAVEVRATAPIVLVCGKNGAGKSSVLNAVRMALTGGTDEAPTQPRERKSRRRGAVGGME